MTTTAIDRATALWNEGYQWEDLVAALRAAGFTKIDCEVRTIAAYAKNLGLQPSPPPEPLPEITEDDIHLVCWLAIVPAERPAPSTIIEQLGELPLGDKL